MGSRVITNRTPDGYRAPQDLLQDKVILVTGAGDGIGRAAALTYATHGATLVLLGRTQSKLDQLYDDIEAAGGAKPAAVTLDLREASEDNYAVLAKELTNEFASLDGLLHNAGVLGERRPIDCARYDAWMDVMQVNVNAQFLLTRHMLPLLQKANAASIIFTSSGVGRIGKAYWGAYAVSKFATEGLMQVLASELENTSAVRVNSLNPGATNTAMRRAAYPGEVPSTNPAPEAIMSAYLYLMGDDSKGVTGQAFDAQ